jgi:hypothetical protein
MPLLASTIWRRGFPRCKCTVNWCPAQTAPTTRHGSCDFLYHKPLLTVCCLVSSLLLSLAAVPCDGNPLRRQENGRQTEEVRAHVERDAVRHYPYHLLHP